MSLLSIEKLKVNFRAGDRKVHAVRGISLDVNRGETVCIVGESGSGKSTLALAVPNLLSGFAEWSADRMDFDGIPLMKLSPPAFRKIRGQRIAVVFQDPMTSLNPSFTVGSQLIEGYLHHMGGGHEQARNRALHLLDRVGIPSPDLRLKQFPHQLSGGLRQRVMIAMALMCGPDLIIADEPTSALDVTIQKQILELFQDLQNEIGMSILFITHDLGVVANIGRKVQVMYAGEIVEGGLVEQVLGEPQHPYTRGLLGSLPGFMPAERGARLASISGNVPNLLEDFVGCPFGDRCAYREERCSAEVPYLPGKDGYILKCIEEGIFRRALS